ncbi:MAG: hypothetical protein ACI3ZJ_07520 [Bacteroidaceae bacterium]
MNSKNRNDYLEAIHASKPRWNRSVTLEEVIQRQRKLNQSLGIKNPYLGMSFSELKALGHGLRG